MDVFKTQTISESLIREYFERNERKKEDEKWLKEYGEIIKEALKDTPKSLIGDFVVSIQVPNTSKFNTDKVLEYLKNSNIPRHVYERCVKLALDEEQFAACVEENLIDINKIREAAWEESTGTPRLTIKKRRTSEND